MTMTLEPLGPPHAALLAGLHRRCFVEPWDEAAMGSLLAMPGAYGFLAASPEQPGAAPVPFGFILCRRAADEAEVLALLVLPPFRRGGVAAALLDAALVEAADGGAAAMFLEVAADNDAAGGLYYAAGFAEVGRRHRYYGGHTDALVLRKDL
jgi:[ribosomal protein S18]-alanine N-acetyltransferase